MKERDKQTFHTNRQAAFRIKTSPQGERKATSKAALARRQANKKNGVTKIIECKQVQFWNK